MEKTSVFDLIGAGFALLRQHPVVYLFGLVVGAATAIPQAFAAEFLADITVDTPESELAAAASTVGLLYLVFTFLILLASAALWTFAVRAAQGDASVVGAVERVRRRIWALVLYSPFVFLVLFVPMIAIGIVVALVESAWPILFLAIVAFIGAMIVYLVGIWGVVPAITISDVRLRNVFYVIWNAFRNGGLRFFVMALIIGVMSLLVTGVVGVAIPPTGALGLGTVALTIVLGFFASWSACAIGYLWIAEGKNVVVGLTDTNDVEITEETMVYLIAASPNGII